ncbi:MAG TPA: extracellular solute-binding protein [Tepidisphaeraceae bacterium]|jgi:multiple sugar transport system permease protein|nr:extracellular solute-binding protein [Tepidisphaeraceae bacterium]
MHIGQSLRYLLGLATLLIVVWAFVDVGARVFRNESRGYDATLSVLHWGDPDEGQIMADLVAAFERDHPKVKVNRIHVSSGEFDSKLKTMFAAGDAPDLFYLKPESTPEMASMKLIKPLDEHVTQAELAEYFPKLLDVFRYNGERSGAGPLYGIPKDFSTTVMYINLDLFKQAGVPVPYGGWTWAEYEQAMRKITDLSTPQRRIYGGMLDLWDATLLNIIWTHGGDFFGKDFRDVLLDEPGAQAAMEMVRRLRHEERTVFNATGIAKDGGQEFLLGNIGSIGPIGRWKTPVYRSINNFEFDVVPVPYAKEKASQLFTNAWAIGTQTKHPEESLQLLRYLVGEEGQARAAKLGLAIPSNRSVAFSEAFHTAGQRPANSKAFLDAIELGRVQQHPREAEFRQIVSQVTDDALRQGTRSVADAGAEVERQWLAELRSPLRTREFSQINWRAIGSITVAVIAALVTLFWWKARREKIGALDRAQQRAGMAFVSPWVIGFVLLTVGPMALSLILAFAKWTAMSPLGEAQYVGGANFEHLAKFDPTFGKSLWVTFYFVLLGVPLTQVAALAVALLMNAKVRGITIFRTIYFVPSVVSGVALATLWLKLFNNDFGLINNVLLRPLTWVGLNPPDWFGLDAGWAAVPAFVVMGLWGVGGGMVIYLAGLKGVPESLYEAATIDGAGPMRRLLNVTLPMLSPLIFFNVIMGLIGSFQIFTQAKVMTNGGPGTDTLFYVLNLYRQAFEFHNMGYASAMAWVLFIIVLIFTALIFRGSKKMVHYEGLKA